MDCTLKSQLNSAATMVVRRRARVTSAKMDVKRVEACVELFEALQPFPTHFLDTLSALHLCSWRVTKAVVQS